MSSVRTSHVYTFQGTWKWKSARPTTSQKLAAPLTVASSQRPFSSVPNVVVLERFDCIIIYFFSFSCRKFCSAFHLNQWLAGRHFHKGIFIVSKINNIVNVSIYDYRKQSAWFFPLEMYSYSFLRVFCNTHYFSDYSIKVFYGSGECLVLNIPTSDSDDIPEIVRRLEEISIGCQVKLFVCVSSYIGKNCPNLTMVGRPIIFRCD